MGRKIKVYEKRIQTGTKAQKWGVSKLRTPTSRAILVLGTGRCGTMFMSKALKKCSLDVEHEKTGMHGTASHTFWVDHHWYPMYPWESGKMHVGERRSDYVYDYVIHMVREPRICISSISKIFPALEYEFLEDHGYDISGSRLRRAMVWYYAVNTEIETQTKHRFRIEDIQQTWKDLPFHKKFMLPDIPPIIKKVNHRGGYRASEVIPWEVLTQTDEPLAIAIKKMARRYGYAV